MRIVQEILDRGHDPAKPFLLGEKQRICLNDILESPSCIREVEPGECVALIGDVDASTISALFGLIEKNAVIMPLTRDNHSQHEYFFDAGEVSCVIENGKFRRLRCGSPTHPLLKALKEQGKAGLILFTSGTTGRPKAILHDFASLLNRYNKPRPALTTLNFLLFDHIGGLNTLFHTIFNGGVIVRPSSRRPDSISKDILNYKVELLPATPTFLRLWLLENPPSFPSLRLVTYGTERMDENTLARLVKAFPDVDIRQTYGMSELGILKIATRKKDELWIRVHGKALTKIVDGELFISSPARMLGYLNAPTPFDANGWYATGDLVKTDGEWLMIRGRKDYIINVGGIKVAPAEVENAALSLPGVRFAKARGAFNPLTGEHVELTCELEGIETAQLKKQLAAILPPYARPARIIADGIKISHRFKQL